MAIKLKQSNKCKIDMPYWLDKKYMEEIIKNEKSSTELTLLPYYYYEILNLLFNKASESISDIDIIKNLSSELGSIRSEKINVQLKRIKEEKYFYKINNITSKELEFSRKVVIDTLNLNSDLNNKNIE